MLWVTEERCIHINGRGTLYDLLRRLDNTTSACLCERTTGSGMAF